MPRFPPLEELRKGSSLISSSATEIGYGKDLLPGGRLLNKLDLEVYLPTLGVNLQRGLVWTPKQKGQLIESIVAKKAIAPFTMAYYIKEDNDSLPVIDGKQRLSTIIAFLAGETFPLFNGNYSFEELPEEYQQAILRFPIRARRGEDLTDRQMVEVFEYLNFLGTPQEEAHLLHLKSHL
jgi:hypothetical protein